MGFDPKIHDAVVSLASACDGAARQDGAGFNKIDARFGHVLAARGLETWSFKMASIAYRMLHKYRGQLASCGIIYDDLEPPEKSKYVEPIHAETKRFVSNDGRSILISLDYRDAEFGTMKDAIKEIPGRRWDPDRKVWTVPLDPEAMGGILAFAAEYDFDFNNGTFELVRDRLENFEVMIEASAAESADFEVEGLCGTLRPFQRAGVAYSVASKRTFICDEMGLGKTVEALATIKSLDAFPALIICPATLKLNWRNESLKWLPGHEVTVLSGTGEETVAQIKETAADLVIINYDIISDWQRDEAGKIIEIQNGKQKERVPAGILKALIEKDFAAIIFDESHALKNSKAQRTDAADHLAHGKDIVLMLTGTPVLNRPVELVSQLRIMGRLNDLGGWFLFVKRYCGAYKGRWGWDLSGATNLDELNRKLRALCYVRRKKEDVLDELPPKTRSTIPVEISNRKEYQRAESDLVGWLVEQVEHDESFLAEIDHLDAVEKKAAIAARKQSKEIKARYAEQLIRLGTLKHLAARGKLKAAIEWIKDFLENDEKLIVFAEHIEIQKKLLKAFPEAAYIIPDIDKGKVEIRQAQIDRFQEDTECKLIICSLEGGGVGWTGTAASNVAFIEMGWNPALHDQAEDRCHRIGQDDNVTCWYLVGSETVDEEVAALIEAKRAVITAATEGSDVEQGSIMKDLIQKLITRK